MQKNLLASLALFLGISINIIAQSDILFSIGDNSVKKPEFEYIYQKNNFNNKADYSRKSLDDYLNLYVNFRLKVKEAIEQGLDKNDKFKEELSSYEKQLLDSYVDKEVINNLIKVEYERSKTDVNVSHIFISTQNINEKEALVKIQLVEQNLRSGMSFEKAAKESEDSKTAEKGGNIGWLNSYQISLPEIEEVVYNMKAGDISGIVKTRLGYHIVKLNEVRTARPKIKVAIIKRFFPIADTSAQVKQAVADTMQMAYAKLTTNEPFEKVVQQFSDDELTKNNQGQLDWFGINTYAKIFEETAYSLKDGEYSKPFKTSTAWYIVKRLETAKPLNYEEAVPVLKAKLQNAPQYQYQMDRYLEKLSDKLAVKSFPDGYAAFRQNLVALAQVAPFNYKDTISPKTLLQIGEKTYNENDFGKLIQESFYTVYAKSGMDKFDALIKKATQDIILNYYKEDIKENNTEYKMLMEEYRNGIMIFTLSEKNVWNKASDDSAGLMAFYNEHKTDFNLKKRATVRTIFTDDLKQAKELYKLVSINKEITDDALLEKMKSLGIVSPEINSQVQNEGKATVNIAVESLSDPHKSGNKYKITQVYNLQPPKARAFNECRGYVVAAYQEYLEKKWIDELKRKYPVSVNKNVFETLVKK